MRGDEFNSKKKTWNKTPSSEFSSSRDKQKAVPEISSAPEANKDKTTNDEIIAKEGRTWTKVSPVPEASSSFAPVITSTAAIVAASSVAVVVGINVVPFTGASASFSYLEASSSSIAYGLRLDDHQEETPFIIRVYNDDYVSSKPLENGENYGSFDSLAPNRSYAVEVAQDKDEGLTIASFNVTTSPKSDFLRFDFPKVFDEYEGTFDVTLSYVDDDNLFSDFELDLTCSERSLEYPFPLEKTTSAQTLSIPDFYIDEESPEFAYDFHFLKQGERIDYASGTFRFQSAFTSKFEGVSCDFNVSEGGYLPLKLRYEDQREYYNDPVLHLTDGQTERIIPLEITPYYQLVDLNGYGDIYGRPLEAKVTLSTPEGEITVFSGTRNLLKTKISKVYEAIPVSHYIYDDEFSMGLIYLDDENRLSDFELSIRQGLWAASYPLAKQEYQAVSLSKEDVAHFKEPVTLVVYGSDSRSPDQRIAFWKEEGALFDVAYSPEPEPEPEKQPVSISASGYVDTFHIGDSFVTGDLSVLLHYDDGTEEAVVGYSVSSPNLEEEGDQTVVISYQGFETSYEIHVIGVESLGVRVLKERFAVGEAIAKEDFEVTALYKDGAEAVVDGYELDAPSLVAPGKYTVSFAYYGVTAEAEINASDPTVLSLGYYDEATRDDSVGCKMSIDATAVYQSFTKEQINFEAYILKVDEYEDELGYSPDETTIYEDYDPNAGTPFVVTFDLAPLVWEQPYLQPGLHTYHLYGFGPSATSGDYTERVLLQSGEFDFGASLISIASQDEDVYLTEVEAGKYSAPFHFALNVVDTDSRWSDFRLETFDGQLVAEIDDPAVENVVDIASFASQDGYSSVGFSITVYDSALGGRAEIIQIGTNIIQA